MKSQRYEAVKHCLLFLSLVFLILIPTSSCKEEKHFSPDDAVDNPRGELIKTSDCKVFDGKHGVSSARWDCIQYDYDIAGGVLRLKHVNAGFNCCPKMDIHIEIENDTIRIIEKEVEGLCDCLCLFDLDYEVVDLPPGEYTIAVLEPYVRKGDEKLEFTVDLAATPSGIHCVERNYYPWLSSASNAPAGSLVDIVGCKQYSGIPENAGEKATGASIPPDMDCMAYIYSSGTLFLTHINAGFNCCPVIDADIDISDSVITITEIEVQGQCYCLCLFDLFYEISDLPPGEYLIIVNEPYVHEGDRPILRAPDVLSVGRDVEIACRNARLFPVLHLLKSRSATTLLVIPAISRWSSYEIGPSFVFQIDLL